MTPSVLLGLTRLVIVQPHEQGAGCAVACLGVVASLAVCSAALLFQQAARGDLFMQTCLHPPQKYVKLSLHIISEFSHAHLKSQPAGPCQHLTAVCDTVIPQSANRPTLS